MERIVWQPEINPSPHFKVYLDGDFASEMINTKLDDSLGKKMNEIAGEEMKRLGVNCLNPYRFYEDTCLLTEVHLGYNGILLSTDDHSTRELLGGSKKRLEYHCHNIMTPKESLALITGFSKWVEYSEIVRGL